MSSDEQATGGAGDAHSVQVGLARAHERALLIAMATEDTIWDWNLKTNHLEFSSKVAKFGHHDWASDPSIRWWERHIHPDDLDATVATVALAIGSGKKSFSVEYRFCKADGDFAYIYDRAYIMHDENGEAIRAVGAMIDVTELRMVKQSLRKTENQLALVTRLNAMGTMGSMIAHELSQPLTAATNFVRSARRLAVSDKPDDVALLQAALGAAEENTVRAGDIIRRLRELVATGSASGCETLLAELLDDGCTIGLDAEKTPSIRFHMIVEPADLKVWVDPIQVQQVIVNLIRNSVEALDNTHQPEIVVRARNCDDFAEISVQDNGSGIASHVRENIFSTVMTAKAEGMGIGLSISRTIIEAQGGKIWLAPSSSGRADFRFTLPLFRADGAAA